MSLRDTVKKAVKEAILLATTDLPHDVEEALRRALEVEEGEAARSMLKAILENVRMAREARAAICQDTGTPTFYVKLGDDFPIRSEIYEVLREAVREATKEIPLRPNTVDPIYERNPGDNTGIYLPWVDIELIPGDYVEIHYVPKGGGSEAPNISFTAPPGVAWEQLKRKFLETIVEYGPMPCPPVVIGIGIGPTMDIAAKLAKKAATLRRVGERHSDPRVAKMEEELLNAANQLGIGPHGVGGRTTVLDVHIEYAHRHPAAFSIGIVFSCWATRRGSVRVYKDGRYEILSHRVS